MDKYASLITLISLVLAIVALSLALWQTFDLKKIRNSLSTRYLGEFSEYYPQVIEMIKETNKSIEILCDFPAYGCFTHPDYWLNYRNELRNKRRKSKHINITCQDEEFRDKSDEEFFREVKRDWNEWRTDPKKRKQLLNFLDGIAYDKRNIDKLEEDKFFELLRETDRLTLKECFRSEEISEIKSFIRLDFWIIDGRQAIFAFTNYAHGNSRSGFFTTDQKLIFALRDIAESYLPEQSN